MHRLNLNVNSTTVASQSADSLNWREMRLLKYDDRHRF